MAISFKRPVSTLIEDYFTDLAAQNSRSYNVEIAAEIVLQDETVLNYATKTFSMDTLSQGTSSVSITPVNFIGRFTGTPEFRHSQAKAPDGGDLEVANLDYVISSAIPASNRIFDNTFLTVYICFPKTSGNYEGVVYFAGMLRDLSGSDDLATLGIVSDLSNKGAVLGREITQRCLNELGDLWCGVGHLPLGATCSKIWQDKVNGCSYWGGVFKGLPFINPTGLTGGNGTVDDGGGWEPYCPDLETTWFPSADGGEIHAKELGMGHSILDVLGTAATVTSVERIWANYRYDVRTVTGAAMIVSATHRFLTSADDKVGIPAVEWYGKFHPMVTRSNEGIRIVQGTYKAREYNIRVAPPGYVLRIETSDPHTYLAGSHRGQWLANHNRKNDGFGNPYRPIGP